MYVEKLQNLTVEDICSMYPDMKLYSKIIFSNDDMNMLYYTIKRDYTNLFDKMLERKFADFPFKTGAYKDNPYKYNECAYIIDCNHWNIPMLREFLVEYCSLTSVLQRTNLFILYNFDIVDRNTQDLVGTFLERYYKRSRFWLIAKSIGNIMYKITSRVFIARIRRPTNDQLKQYLMNTISPPTFEILIDKIIEKADDYASALIYLDMLTIDPTILNRNPFQEEIEIVDRFIYDGAYREENYPMLRETCFRLLEKQSLIDIFYLFIRHFVHKLPADIFSLALSKATDLQNSDYIPNKQIWLLESWFLHIILLFEKGSPTSKLVLIQPTINLAHKSSLVI